METSNKSTGKQFSDQTSSAVDTLANPLAQQAKNKAKTTQNTCGPNISQPFAHYDPNSQSWKTLQITLSGDLEQFSQTWPRSGMTRNGIAYQLQPLAPLTSVTESSSLHWTPTATANYAAPSMKRRKGADGYLNPTWVEWLMGFPIGWTDCED
jgi:hypothetical protein